MKDKYKNSKVAVILGFYNGRQFILPQLESILKQTHKDLDIFIFDDNSTENIDYLKSYLDHNSYSNIKIIRRKKNLGYAKNFLQGLKDVGEKYEYFAFSDQDDIWRENKIEMAINHLKEKEYKKIAKLYFSRTAYYCSDCINEIGSSRIFKKPISFSNALLQNIAGGNTILMNSSARKIVIQTVGESNFISHDWWCYLIISGAGGRIIFDKTKTLKYRQHKKNLIGMNIGFDNQKSRFFEFANGKVKNWLDSNIENLSKHKYLLSKNNLKILNNFSKARRSKNLFLRLFYFYRSGVYRQSSIENFVFIIGIIFKKI